MKKELKTIGLDAYEEGAVIEGLNRIRTEHIDREETAEFISELMLKIIRTPNKKSKVRDEAR